MRRAARLGALATVGVLLLGACGGAEPEGEQDPRDAAPAVIDVEVAPGAAEDDFVGAREDVSDLTCEREEGAWVVRGTVTNPLDAPVDYRVYNSLLDGTRETLGVQQIDVAGVDPGEGRGFEGRLEVDAEGLDCVLRVERVPAG